MTQSECPKCDCEEVPKQHTQVEKPISVKKPGAHFTLKISANRDL